MSGTDVPLKELPPFVPKAFIAIEDRRFFSHFGIDPLGLPARRLPMCFGRRLPRRLDDHASNSRRIVSDAGAHALAQAAGSSCLRSGSSASSARRRFSSSTSTGSISAPAPMVSRPRRSVISASPRAQVKIAEAAMLAGLVKSPSRLAPSRNPDGAETPRADRADGHGRLGFITEAAAKTALAQPARAVVKPLGSGSVNYVADWIMDVLDDLVGRVEQDLVVETSIDPALQAAAEKALVEELALKGGKLERLARRDCRNDPGGRRACAGWRQELRRKPIQPRRRRTSASRARHSSLSSISPRWSAGSRRTRVREDKPIALKGWKPENYSREYYGPVTLAQALALSLNTVAVRLTLEFGPIAVARTAYRLGIASKLEPNPSLALGTSEVSLIELVSAYAPFANGGNAVAPHVVERVRTRDGKVLFRTPPQNLGRIIEPRYVAHDERDDAGNARHAAPPAARSFPAGRPPARPEPARISATPGSSATPAAS